MATSQGMTLEEAINRGRGVERPFKCPVHDDHMASATVNVLKGVWFCHACHAKGKTSGKAVPKLDDLLAMMEPEKAARRYPESYLDLFIWAGPKYWDDFLQPWVTYQLRMGQDPLTGDATFPVYTPSGALAGVGRRHVTEDKQKRYLYPSHWSAAQALGGLGGQWRHYEVITLVEGMKDAASVWETGCPGICTYGSGLHLPQVELVNRIQPKLVLLGFDMDDAGEEAVSRAFSQIGRMATLVRVRWPKGDPAECTLEERKEALSRAVTKAGYGDRVVTPWHAHVAKAQATYARFEREFMA